MNASCQQQAALAAVIGLLVDGVLVTLCIGAFYGWRRMQPPWRPVAYAVFIFCALLLFDQFVLTLVFTLNPDPVTASTATCR